MLHEDISHLQKASAERHKACEELRLSLASEQQTNKILEAEHGKVKAERDLKVGKAKLQKDVTSLRKLSAEISNIEQEVAKRLSGDPGRVLGHGLKMVVDLS